MKLIRDFHNLPEQLRHGAVTIGNFDGVHLGHARIVSRLIAQARAVKGPAVVFTFDPHPVRLLRPSEAPPPLTWTDRKAQLLFELGVDAVIAYPTDEALLKLTAQEFFGRILRDRLAARAIVEGPNFFFGLDRGGTIDVLRGYCEQDGIVLEVVEPIVSGGAFVSSSRVRSLIVEGDVAAAAQMLTRPYRVRGMVRHGAGRGAKLGFPTANIEAIDTLLPKLGVYAGLAHAGGVPWPAAINLGPNPTFGEQAVKVEVHLIDWEGPLYGQPLEVDFLGRLRDIQRFSGVDELLAQLRRDVAAAREMAVDYLQSTGRAS
ncbi:MAG: bifunctional riboflavin kinase/FAD synthetase [Pirellulales bacterium]|nr:bifunctional riboflavin kinase/FAD synthetase [Pirellulales bacterium]